MPLYLFISDECDNVASDNRQDFWNEWQVAGGKLCLSMGLKVVIIFSLQISLCLEYEDIVQIKRCVKYQRSTSWLRKQIKDESYSSDICDKQFLIRQCLCSLHESPCCLLDYLLHVCYEQQNGVVKVLSRKLRNNKKIKNNQK